MKTNFLQNGFYVSGLPGTYSYGHMGSNLQTGAEFKGIDQPYSMEYEFTIFAINNKVKGNTEGLVRIVNRTLMEDFAFKKLNRVSPKTVHDFYEELIGASNFDFSKRYASTTPRQLKEHFDKIILGIDTRLEDYASGDVFKRVHEETDTGSTRISEAVVEFSSKGMNFTLKKLMVKLVSQGIAQYGRTVRD